MKKYHKIILTILFLICGLSLIPSLSASAADPDKVNNQTTSSCRYFLGFTSWDCGTKFTQNNYTPTQDELVTGISLIAVNVLTDITVVAAYLVLGYVIYGGYLYTFSGGDPNKVATGKKTLSQAFIGLAIVMSANLIMSTIRFALLGANGSLGCDLETGAGCADGNEIVNSAIQWFIAIAGIVSAIFVVYGGISYVTSSGDPGKLQKAKQTIIYALIGLAIVALAEVITAFVSNMIRTADNAALINKTTLSKEVYEKNIH